MQQLSRFLLISLSIAYPFVVFWAVSADAMSVVLILLSSLLVLRLATSESSVQLVVTGVMMIALLLIFVCVDVESALKFYPVIISSSLLSVFASSLLRGMPVIEQIARIKTPELPPAAVLYTRQVTIVWCGFFIVNGLIAAWTALQPRDDIWLLYNGVIAYLLMGGLFAGEWCIRKRMMERSQ